MPGGAPQLGQADGLLLGAADVFAHQVQARGGDKDKIRARKGDLHIIPPHLVHLDALHPHKPADAVVLVDHQVSGMQVGKALDMVFAGGPALFAGLSGALAPVAQHDRFEGGIFRAGGQGLRQDAHLPRPGLGRVRGAGNVRLRQKLRQVLCPGTTAGQQQNRVVQPQVLAQLPPQVVNAAAGGGKLLGGEGDEHLGCEGRPGQKAVQQHRRGQPGCELPLVQAVAGFGGGDQAFLQQVAHVLGLPVGHALGGLQHGGGVAHQEQGVLRQIGQGAGRLRVDLGKIAVRGGQAAQLLQGVRVGKKGLFQRRGGPLACRQLFQGGAQAVQAPFRQGGQGFPHRQQSDGVHRLGAPLGQGVEPAQRVHLVAPKLGADGGGVPRRKYIQDAAPEGELAGSLHLGASGVARLQQPLRQRVHRVAAVGGKGHHRPVQRLRRQGVQHQGIGRGAQHPGLAGADLPQGLQPLLLVFMRNALHVVKHQVAAGQQGGFHSAQGQQVGGKGLCRLLVPQYHADGAAGQIAAQGGGQMGAVDGRRAVDCG